MDQMTPISPINVPKSDLMSIVRTCVWVSFILAVIGSALKVLITIMGWIDASRVFWIVICVIAIALCSWLSGACLTHYLLEHQIDNRSRAAEKALGGMISANISVILLVVSTSSVLYEIYIGHDLVIALTDGALTVIGLLFLKRNIASLKKLDLYLKIYGLEKFTAYRG